jgi:hypothetical protein
VQNSKDNQSTTTIAPPSSPALTLIDIVNYITNVVAVDTSTGEPDAGKIVKLNGAGMIDPTMLPTPPIIPNTSYVTDCAFNPMLNNTADPLFTRVNKTDIARVPGVGLKVTRIVSTNSAGSFFGGGVGNKAFLGIASAHGTKVSNFTSLKVRLKHLDGNFVYVNMLVDLDGDFTTAEDRFTVTIDSYGSFFNFATFTTVSLAEDDPVWWASAVGTVPIAQTGLNQMFTGPTKTLDDLKALNPNAKFYTGVFFDGGYPKNCAVAAVNVTFGDSVSIIHQATLV